LGVQHRRLDPVKFSFKFAEPAREISASRATVFSRLVEGAREENFKSHARFPKWLALQPVVRGCSIMFATRKSLLRAFDHATLARGAPDQSVDSGRAIIVVCRRCFASA
jgi:hypothetical protein